LTDHAGADSQLNARHARYVVCGGFAILRGYLREIDLSSMPRGE
jgi:hypothetical protein